jgi:hypothetical protein
MDKKQSRRTFIGGAALAAGAAAAGVNAQKQTSSKPKNKRATVELLNVGVVGVGENSHLNYSIYSPTINPVEPDIWPVRSTNMNISHCWDSRPEVAEAYAKKYKCQAVKNYYDMVDKVDGMIFEGLNEVKWWPQLTKPYLEAGIPCFISRPFALSMKAANEIVDRAKKYNAPILCTDEREYIKEAQVGRWKVEELLKEKRNILGTTGDNSSDNYPQYVTHGLYFMLAILGLDVAQVSFQADSWWREVIPGVKSKMHWGLLSLQYNGIKIEGVGEQTVPFVATQQQIVGQRANAGMKIYYSGGWWDIMNYWEAGEPLNRIYQLFFPTIFAIQRMFETRKMQWSYDYILQKTRIFLTGFKSHVDHKGQMIRVADLPDNWEAPHFVPNWIDEKIFE